MNLSLVTLDIRLAIHEGDLIITLIAPPQFELESVCLLIPIGEMELE